MSSVQVVQNGMSNAANMSCIYSKKLQYFELKVLSKLPGITAFLACFFINKT